MMKCNLFASPLFRKLHAKWLYRRGIVRAKLGKNQLSIADYSAVIDMAEAPVSIRSMALYNRALVYHATACESQAVADLQAVLKMTGATANVITEAPQKTRQIGTDFKSG